MTTLTTFDVEYTTALIQQARRLETAVRLASEERRRLMATILRYRLTLIASVAMFFATFAIELARNLI